tara:strand:+ start:3820 stop:4248 length:429 start_codon:yes stop_codon:yes gene_type:complete
MPTILNKPITREVDILGEEPPHHVQLSPNPEPCIMFRRKGTRGKWKSVTLSSLLNSAESVDTVSRVQETLNKTLRSLNDHALIYRDVMSKLHVSLSDEPAALIKIRDVLRDIYTVDLLGSELSDEDLEALGVPKKDIEPLAD